MILYFTPIDNELTFSCHQFFTPFGNWSRRRRPAAGRGCRARRSRGCWTSAATPGRTPGADRAVGRAEQEHQPVDSERRPWGLVAQNLISCVFNHEYAQINEGLQSIWVITYTIIVFFWVNTKRNFCRRRDISDQPAIPSDQRLSDQDQGIYLNCKLVMSLDFEVDCPRKRL